VSPTAFFNGYFSLTRFSFVSYALVPECGEDFRPQWLSPFGEQCFLTPLRFSGVTGELIFCDPGPFFRPCASNIFPPYPLLNSASSAPQMSNTRPPRTRNFPARPNSHGFFYTSSAMVPNVRSPKFFCIDSLDLKAWFYLSFKHLFPPTQRTTTLFPAPASH